MSLTDRIAVVTGAGSGIGRAIALAMAAAGARVAAVDIDEATARDTASLCAKAGGRSLGIQADTSRGADVDRAVTAAVKDLGPLDVMVNNAGVLDGYFNVDETDEALWRRVLDIDLTGVFLGSKRALREMLPRGKGRIVNMASVAGLNGTGGGAAYVAAKHGVVGFTKTLALEVAELGITSNAICPGYVMTPIVEKQIDDQARVHGIPRENVIREVILAPQPTKQFVRIEDVAALALYLASDAAAQVNGASLSIDGGWTAR